MHKVTTKLIAVLICACVVIFPTTPAYGQALAQQAGEVSARLPQGQIERPGARLVADPGTDVFWDDLVTTDQRGRVRITLGDSSVLNVGSDSSLRVVRHNQQTRQTDMTLTFGKLRSRLQKLDPSRGERFEIRTNTAVLGVIGTHFFVEATATMTRVIVYEGIVLVRNISPAVRGERRVAVGFAVLIFADQPPLSPTPAEPAELVRSYEDTVVDEPVPTAQELIEGEVPLLGAEPEKRTFWQKLTKNKWLFFGAIAAIATVSIAVPVATGGKKAEGCSIPPCPGQ